ncbi:PH domain-containing protein [Ferrimonas pelagia]|uniref:PH domain-containing protein n=1 Tax=Ferrimonas pelagia TaxID=1177826 RepID=A0ABP9FIN0_9GAMM
MARRFEHWSRLSAWSIVSFSLSFIRSIVSNGYALIPLLFAGWQQGFSAFWLGLIGTGFGLLVLLYAVVQWAKFRFRLLDDKLGLTLGVLVKKAQEIPLDKIQNVRLEQPLYYRPMGLYSLVVETAGSKKDEATLAAISYRQALQLKQRLISTAPRQNATQVAENATRPESPTSQVLSQPPASALIKFGFYQNNLLWLAILLSPIFGQLDQPAVQQSALFQSVSHWLDQLQPQTLSSLLLLGLSAALGLLLLLSLISILSAVLKYHPYRLTLQDNALHRTGGLVAKQHDVLALHRVQAVQFRQPLLARILKLWTVSFKQVTGSEIEQRGSRPMLIPSLLRQNIASLLPQLSQLSSRASALPTHYHRIHIGWFWRRGPLTFIAPALATLAHAPIPLTLLLWLGATLYCGILYLRYRNWGYRLEGNDCWIHSGALGHQWTLIALQKVQHVAITQSPSQRRNQLASLELGLACGAQTIPYLPLNDARAIAERALALISADNGNWI